MTPSYSMLIRWSAVDRAFLVSFPELTGETPQTHGETYVQAARNGQDALDGLVKAFRSKGLPLPPPALDHYSEEPEWSDQAPATA